MCSKLFFHVHVLQIRCQTRKLSSLDLASTTLLLIYSFQFRSAFDQQSACTVTGFPTLAFTLQSKKNVFLLDCELLHTTLTFELDLDKYR